MIAISPQVIINILAAACNFRITSNENSIVADGKYHMLPTGELLVFSVTSADAHFSYRCRTVHRVTGDTVESSSYARLVVSGKFTNVYHILSL